MLSEEEDMVVSGLSLVLQLSMVYLGSLGVLFTLPSLPQMFEGPPEILWYAGATALFGAGLGLFLSKWAGMVREGSRIWFGPALLMVGILIWETYLSHGWWVVITTLVPVRGEDNLAVLFVTYPSISCFSYSLVMARRRKQLRTKMAGRASGTA